jgi:hypothetical protein
MTLLARRHGGELALLAGGTAVLLAPGWSPGSTLALVALAAGSVLGDGGWRSRTLAALVLVAPLAWEPRAALLGMVGGIALAAPRAALAPALGLAVLARLLPPAPEAGGFGIVTLPLLVPAFLLLVRGRWERPATALLLTVAARLVPGPAALAAPLALAVLGTRREGAGAVAQRVWTGVLLFGACLLAAYPWLRPAPLGDLVALLGPVRRVAAGAVIVAVAFELGSALPWGDRLRHPAAVAGKAGIVLFLALFTLVPRPGVRLLRPEQALRLDAASPVWEAALPAGALSSLAIESVLTNSSDLPAEAPVATITLFYKEGSLREITRTLRAGRETGEWAARRPDVTRAATAAGKPVPPPWLGWVAGSFFGQRFRAGFTFPPGDFDRLRIERRQGLPGDLEIAVQQIEVGR